MGTEQTIFVVDDNELARQSFCALVKGLKLSVEEFASAEEFLEQFDPSRSGCAVIDLNMPGMNGLDLQTKLSEKGSEIPIIILSAHATLRNGIRAMKQGAMTVLEKSCSDRELCDTIVEALSLDRKTRESKTQTLLSPHFRMHSQLSARQHEVLQLIVAGSPNKVTAKKLGISVKTVEKHRSNIMKSMNSTSVADLVRKTILAEMTPNVEASRQ